MICAAPDTQLYQHLVAAGGGFLGGVSMLAYMRPYGVADGLRRIVVSTVSAFFLAAFVANKVLGSSDPELVAAAAFLIGFSSWSLLGAVARFFENRKDDDIVGMIKSYKDTGVAPPAAMGAPPRPMDMPKKSEINNPDG